MSKKLEVTKSGGWILKDGSHVEYYDVGNWSMEVIDSMYQEQLEDIKHAIKAHKAWYRFLKKQAKKNPRH